MKKEEGSKCQDCGCDINHKKHEWFYCPVCWEKRLINDSPLPSPKQQSTATDSAQGIMNLIEALGTGDGPGTPKNLENFDMLENKPLYSGDAYWFQSPLVRAQLQGERPRGLQWLKFFWNIDFFIEKFPVGKTIIAIIILLSFLF